MPGIYYVARIKHNFMSTCQLLQKGYRIYKEDNHCVILDKKPRNFIIARIQMKSNRMFPLTLKPVMKGKIAQAKCGKKTTLSSKIFKLKKL